MGGLRVRAGLNQPQATAAGIRLGMTLGAALTLIRLNAGVLTGLVNFWTHAYPDPVPPRADITWIILSAVVLWITVDARPSIALATYAASSYTLPQLLGYAGYQARPLAPAWLYFSATSTLTLGGGRMAAAPSGRPLSPPC